MNRVFVVDDEPFIIEGLHHIVDWREFGMEITGYAHDGRAALKAIQEHGTDLLITDISMPEMSGLELIRELRATMPQLKIIVLSGFNEFDYLKEGMKYGIENYLLKPVNVQELKETLRVAAEKLNASTEQRWSDNDIGILRDNILYRWMAGRISQGELKERASMLPIDIAAPYFMAAVVRSPGREETGHAAIVAAMGESGATVFRDFDGDTVILFALADASVGRKEAMAALESLRGKLPGSLLRISVGETGAGMGGASASYMQARGAQEHFLIRIENETIDCAKLCDKESDEPFSYDFVWPDYVRFIHAADSEGLERRIADDIAGLRGEPGVTPAALRSSVSELLRLFRSEVKTGTQADQELYQMELDTIGRATDIGEVVELAGKAGKRLIASLDREAKSPVIAGLLNRIHTSYGEPLSLKQLGGDYNVHPVYLGQLFQKETGAAFTEYLNRWRIGKAKELLRESNYKVHEIAIIVGYTETGYFYKQFKKHVGISPLDYKEMH